MENSKKITISEIEEAPGWLRDNGVGIHITNVEISMAETRQSPTHGQYSSNRAGVTLSATIAVDATDEDSCETLEKIITALTGEVGSNLQRVMGSMS